MSYKRRIGIMGGTFDPIHNAHLMIAKKAYEQFNLDEVLFMPTGTPPHKADKKVTESKHRANMVRIAIKDIPYFIYSDFEVKRRGNTYTADTLSLLRENKKYSDSEIYFIIGADSLAYIEEWYKPEIIFQKAILVVAKRDENEDMELMAMSNRLEKIYHGKIYIIHIKKMDISSEMIRTRVSENKSITGIVPLGVEQYIYLQNLYRK